MKKYVNILAILIIGLFGFISYVKADNLYDSINKKDIIIGNTVFRSGTWISSTRASKAGALYTKNTGSTDVRTLIYITDNLWVELDPETDQYRYLSDQEIEEVENNTKIYYENNVGITKNYQFNYIDPFGNNDDNFSISNVSNENVIYNDENNSWSCEYGSKFVFEITFNDGYDDYSEKYVGICGNDNYLEYELFDHYSFEPLSISNISIADTELASLREYNNPLISNNNQSKILNVSTADYYYDEAHTKLADFKSLEIQTLGELNSISNGRKYGHSVGKWVGLKVELGNDNSSYNYDVYLSNIPYFVELGDGYLNIWIDINEYSSYESHKLIIIDKQYKEMQEFILDYINYSDELKIEYNTEYPEEIVQLNSIRKVFKYNTNKYEPDSYNFMYGNNKSLYFDGQYVYLNTNVYGSSYVFKDADKIEVLASHNIENSVEITSVDELNYLVYENNTQTPASLESYNQRYNDIGEYLELYAHPYSYQSFMEYEYNIIKNVINPSIVYYVDYFFKDNQIPDEDLALINELSTFNNVIINNVSDTIYE